MSDASVDACCFLNAHSHDVRLNDKPAEKPYKPEEASTLVFYLCLLSVRYNCVTSRGGAVNISLHAFQLVWLCVWQECVWHLSHDVCGNVSNLLGFKL